MNLKTAARWLWRNEPALLGGGLSVLVTVGVITAQQGSAVSSAISAVVAAGVELAAAFGVRSQVTPPH